jgi:DNA-binding NarL/FixJ family response regulator
MIRVLAVCKTNNFIRFIEPFLSAHGINIAQVCKNSAQASEIYRYVQPDVVIIDANWSNNPRAISSVELIRQLRGLNPNAKIIIATNTYEPNTILRLKEYDIDGYFYRNAEDVINEIAECIKRAVMDTVLR